MARRRLDAILLYGTFGLLMFGPLAFGAVEPWSTFILEAGSVLLMLLWLRKQWLDGEMTIQWNPLFLPMAGSGFSSSCRSFFGASAYRHDTISGALLYCAYAMLCFLSGANPAAQLSGPQDGRDPRHLRLRHRRLCTAAGHFSQRQAVLAYASPAMGGWIYGPYVNHNHYAGLDGTAGAHSPGSVSHPPGRR